ncbi:hypothetical protein AB1287_10630 [Enterobacter asburiae]|uniref:hypothetical protein n=1 Tax=Scandinavium sp. UTDF21-P1B TaxID=3446379 RepID=UPI00347483F6
MSKAGNVSEKGDSWHPAVSPGGDIYLFDIYCLYYFSILVSLFGDRVVKKYARRDGVLNGIK